MNAWDTFWLRKAPPHALAYTRIALGLFLLLYAGLYGPHITLLFSREGIVLPLYIAPPSPLAAHIIYGMLILSLLGITIGAWFRVSVAVAIALGLYYWQLQLHLFPASYNRILLFCLTVLLFSGAHHLFSVDAWRRKRTELISILPQRLIAVQISVTFFGVSMQKWWLPDWQDGSILIYSFLGRWATPLTHWFVQLPLTLDHYSAIVLLLKILQPLAAIGLWFPRTRVVSIVFLSGFLLLVATMLSIWWFVFIIPAFILFFPPERVAACSPFPTK